MTMNNWITLNLTTKGPFNLKRTLETGHSSFPIPPSDKSGRYYLVITIPNSGKKVVSRFYQKGQKLVVELSTHTQNLSDNEIKVLRQLFRKMFGLHINMLDFYETFKKDPIASSFQHCNGIRLT
ncbi:MAG: hypothetical protein ACTSSH_11025, partial [Candidatus Heimdallarchaeota archaeon]